MGELGQARANGERSGASVTIVGRIFLLLVAVALVATGCKQRLSTTPNIDSNSPVEVVIPEHGAYTGAFIDFGDAEDEVALEMIEDFESMVGKHQAIIASSSYWG